MSPEVNQHCIWQVVDCALEDLNRTTPTRSSEAPVRAAQRAPEKVTSRHKSLDK